LSPTVVIVSPNDDPGIQLLKLLRCLCRRSVLLGDVSQLELLSLPLFLSPTLLMNRPLLTRRFAKFVSSTNRRGMNTVKAGKVLEVCCPKAIYLGSDRIPAGMISTTIQIALPPSPTRTTILDDETLSKLTAEFQGKLLEYRLANYSKVQISAVPGIRVASPSLEIAMNLAACIVNDTELAAGMISLLEEQVRRVSGEPGQTLEAAIVAALLAALHDRKSNRIQVKEIAALANALLRTQGEITEYSAEEVGHQLDVFSLWRTRHKEGKFLILNRETSRVVHQLALQLGVAWDVESATAACLDCELLRTPGGSSLEV
jgi:hypothetical protein